MPDLGKNQNWRISNKNLTAKANVAHTFAYEGTTVNTVSTATEFIKLLSSGTPEAGIGTGLIIRTESLLGSANISGRLYYILDNVTSGAEYSHLEFGIEENGSTVYPASLYPGVGITSLGDIEGFVVTYSSTTAVGIKAGKIFAKDTTYILAADTTHNMTSLAASFDYHYVYIDDSVSTSPPTAVIIDSTVEPAWSDDSKGWYNGDDLCIGVVASPAGNAIVASFTTMYNGKEVTYQYGKSDILQMASDMNPDSTWQTPDDNDGSVATPVNAKAIKIVLTATDVGANCAARASSSELAALKTTITDGDLDFGGYNFISDVGWVVFGSSRNIKIAGTNDDDDALSCWCNGFKISR